MLQNKIFDIKLNFFKIISSVAISLILCLLVFIYQNNKIHIFELKQRQVMNAEDFVSNSKEKIISSFSHPYYNDGENIGNFNVIIKNLLFSFIHQNIFLESFNKSPLKYFEKFKLKLNTILSNNENEKILDNLFKNFDNFYLYFDQTGYLKMSSNQVTIRLVIIYEDKEAFIKDNVINNPYIQKVLPLYINYYFESSFYEKYTSELKNYFINNIDNQIFIYQDLKDYYTENKRDYKEKYIFEGEIDDNKESFSFDGYIYEQQENYRFDGVIYELQNFKERILNNNISILNILPTFVKLGHQDILIINSLFNISTYIIFFILNFLIIYLLLFYIFRNR